MVFEHHEHGNWTFGGKMGSGCLLRGKTHERLGSQRLQNL